jgi:spore maturation protein B
VRIIPYLVAILFAIAMFRASGAMAFLQDWLRTPLSWIGMPPEVLPMAIVRPLTGSGSLGVLADMVKQYGPDALVVRMAATIYGSTETTFYVLAVYFGAVNIRNTRHALPAGLIADACSILLSCWMIRWFFGH